MKLISVTLESLKSIEEKQRALDTLCDLFNNKKDDHALDIMFKGYLLHHSRGCNKEDCSLRKYRIIGDSIYIDNDIVSLSKRKNVLDKMQSILLEHLNQHYSLCVKMHPHVTSARLAHALFKIEYTHNHYSALQDIFECKKLPSTFIEEFLIFHYENIINDFQRMKEFSYEGSIALSIEYERNLKMLEEKLNRVALLHSQLWSSLIEESPDYQKVRDTGFKALDLLYKIEAMWDKLQSIAPNVSKALKLYANFHLYVLNDKKGYEALTNRSNDYMIVRNFPTGFKGLGQSSEGRCNFIGDGSPCMIIGGDTESFGHIVDCNLAVCREFGYKKSELIGKSVEIIFPSVIAKYKMNLLRSHDKEEIGENLVYGLHRNGYIFPMLFKIVERPSLLNELNFVALIYIDKISATSQDAHVLLDKYCKIVGISSKSIKTLELTVDILRRHTLRMESLYKQLKERKDNILNDEEMVINYICPEFNDELEKEDSEPQTKPMYIFSNSYRASRKRRRSLSLSSNIIKLTCKVTQIGTKNEVLGYMLKIKIPDEKAKSIKEQKSSVRSLEFRYDKKLNRYFQAVPDLNN